MLTKAKNSMNESATKTSNIIYVRVYKKLANI